MCGWAEISPRVLSSANATQRKALEFGRIGIDAISISALLSVDDHECWHIFLIYVPDGPCPK